MKKESVTLRVRGIVQGVGFRYFTVREAKKLGVSGFVRNEPDGSVYAYAEGGKLELEDFIDVIRKGPRFGSVMEVGVEWGEYSGAYKDFDITY